MNKSILFLALTLVLISCEPQIDEGASLPGSGKITMSYTNTYVSSTSYWHGKTSTNTSISAMENNDPFRVPFSGCITHVTYKTNTAPATIFDINVYVEGIAIAPNIQLSSTTFQASGTYNFPVSSNEIISPYATFGASGITNTITYEIEIQPCR